MSYVALYRSYRPTSFSEVAGQKIIIKILQNAIKSNTTSHAYVFSGPRGVGKTTVARILAKMVNCTNPNEDAPCNVCDNCKEIENNSVDIIEIDAASNNGVEEMRSLLEKVRFLPSYLNKKVYIIDEAHMLSVSAFNALLKTLEEPPAHVMFILATTEPNKILPTILSRCQRLDFKPISPNDIKEKLAEICLKAKIKITEDAMIAISNIANGGMRDALSIVDQANAYADQEITKDDVYTVTGNSTTDEIIKLLKLIKEQNMIEINILINDLLDNGKEVNKIISNLQDVVKDIILYQKTKNTYNDSTSVANFTELANEFDTYCLHNYLELIQNTLFTYKNSYINKTVLEILLIKMQDMPKQSILSQQKVVEIKDNSEEVKNLEIKLNKITNELIKLDISNKFIQIDNNLKKLEELPNGLAQSVTNDNTIIDLENVNNKLSEIDKEINNWLKENNSLTNKVDENSNKIEEVLQKIKQLEKINLEQTAEVKIKSEIVETKEKEQSQETIKQIEKETDVEKQVEKEKVESIPCNKAYNIAKIENILHEAISFESRQEKARIQSLWTKIESYATPNQMGMVKIIKQGEMVAASTKGMIVVLPNITLCNHLTTDENIKDIKEIFIKMLNKDNYIAILPTSTWEKIRMEYRSQYSKGIKHPKLSQLDDSIFVPNNIDKNNFKLPEDEAYNKAVELFGYDLVEKEK